MREGAIDENRRYSEEFGTIPTSNRFSADLTAVEPDHSEASRNSPRASSANDIDGERGSESEQPDPNALRSTPEPGLVNPLDPSKSDSYTINTASKRCTSCEP